MFDGIYFNVIIGDLKFKADIKRQLENFTPVQNTLLRKICNVQNMQN